MDTWWVSGCENAHAFTLRSTLATTRTTATTHCNYPRSHREIECERERERVHAVGCKWPRHCSRYGSENETRLGRQVRPTNRPYKTANCLQRFLHTLVHTHTHIQPQLQLLLFTRFTLFILCSLFHILYLTARLDSTTCFNFAQFFQHNNRFNRIFNCSSIGRTHTLCPGPGPRRRRTLCENPFLVLQRAHVHFGALFP